MPKWLSHKHICPQCEQEFLGYKKRRFCSKTCKTKYQWQPGHSFNQAHCGSKHTEAHRAKISQSIRASEAYKAARPIRVAIGRAHFNRPVIHPVLTPSAELAYLLGALKGDGCVYISKLKKPPRQDACIFLGATAFPFVQAVAGVLKSIGLHTSLFMRRMHHVEHKPLHCVLAHSLAFVTWYKSLTLECIKETAKGWETEFLRGFFEAEGSLYWRKVNRKYSEISICNTESDLIDMCRGWLLELGFHPRITVTAHPIHKTRYSLRLYRVREVERFLSLIKPCIKNGQERIETAGG